jgi:hypothetical protein
MLKWRPRLSPLLKKILLIRSKIWICPFVWTSSAPLNNPSQHNKRTPECIYLLGTFTVLQITQNSLKRALFFCTQLSGMTDSAGWFLLGISHDIDEILLDGSSSLYLGSSASRRHRCSGTHQHNSHHKAVAFFTWTKFSASKHPQRSTRKIYSILWPTLTVIQYHFYHA